MLSGAAAMWLRKGSRRHIIAGNIFVISMLALSTTGMFMGWVGHHLFSAAMGTMAFYLVVTGLLTSAAFAQHPRVSAYALGSILLGVPVYYVWMWSRGRGAVLPEKVRDSLGE